MVLAQRQHKGEHGDEDASRDADGKLCEVHAGSVATPDDTSLACRNPLLAQWSWVGMRSAPCRPNGSTGKRSRHAPASR